MSNTKEGWLKVKLQHHSKWHRRYCIIDWERSVLFIAAKVDAHYKNWIKLLPNVIITDCDFSLHTEINSNLHHNVIEIKADNGTTTHLLQADTNTDYDFWLIALKRAAFSRYHGAIFCQSLEDTYKYSRDKSNLVPLIIRQCCNYLLENGVKFVGLFRVPGKSSIIKELRENYDRGLTVNFDDSYSPATIASLLKVYLQSLPEPVIPSIYFDDFLEIGSRLKYNQNDDLGGLKEFIERNLSTINYAVLAYLCLFLKKLSEHYETTKMDTDNLAVVFGSNLIRPSEQLDLNMIRGHNYNLIPLIKVLIDHSEYIFSKNSSNQIKSSVEEKIQFIKESSIQLCVPTNKEIALGKYCSSSMPSLSVDVLSSSDSENTSLNNELESNDIHERSSKLHSENQNDLNAQSLQTKSSSNDSIDFDRSKDRKKSNRISMEDILNEEKRHSDIVNGSTSPSSISMPIRKMERISAKKGFANKFGKSLNAFKQNMSKALQSHSLTNENDLYSNDVLTNQQNQRKSIEIESKELLNEIGYLKESLEKKDLFIVELINNFNEERLQFQREKTALNQAIEKLENDNQILKTKLNMQ